MAFSFPDSLGFGASAQGGQVTARQSLELAKRFLLGLEAVSPWRRPFDVSGMTAQTGNLPIAKDLSDFDDVGMRALGSYTDV